MKTKISGNLIFALILAGLILAGSVDATRTITGATLNGASSVTVKGGTSITAAVTVTTDSTSTWKSTG